MGRNEKKRRSHKTKPVLTTNNTLENKSVGRISSSLIDSVYSPRLSLILEKQSEQYANSLLEYEESIKDAQDDIDGSAKTTVKPSINSLLFASTFAREEFLSTVLSETSEYFTTVGRSAPQWKVHANAAKFERQLDEKYGRLRPFITQHPEIEVFLRSTQRKLAKGEFSPFRRGDPPMDKKASIILLFILHRNGVRLEVTFLSTLFLLVGLQPWALVFLVAVGRYVLERRRRRKIAGWLRDDVKVVEPYYAKATESVPSTDKCAVKKAKHSCLLQPVGVSISPTDFCKEEVEGDETFDTLLVGSGPSSLYTAALLARTGRSVLVLSQDKDASGVQTLSEGSGKIEAFANVPFDIGCNNVTHTSKQQQFLAPALCNETDAQGGIRFARIGTEADGYASDILSIPGMGVDNPSKSIPFPLAGGARNIIQDSAIYLGDGWPDDDDGVGNSTAAVYFGACASINASASQYYISKILPEAINKVTNENSYQESSIRYAASFANKVLPLNAHIRSLVAGMGMRGENLPPCKTSLAAHATNICALGSPEGSTYPVGGPRALCHALASVVEQNGGKVLTGVRVKEFLFKETDNENENDARNKTSAAEDNDPQSTNALRCYGVELADNRVISVGTDDDCSVISMNGFIQTFIFNMAPEIRNKYGIPAGLPGLTERRPLLHFLIGLCGNSKDLNLTSADWYRLPNASLARDEVDPVTGEIALGTIGAKMQDDDDDDDDDDESNQSNDANVVSDKTESKNRDKRSKKVKKPRRQKFISGSSWIKVSFPSAKDPSWKERHGDISTCVVTVEADDDFVQLYDTSPKIYSNIKFGSGESSRLLERVTKDLIDNFPQLSGKIECFSMLGPVRVGLSHTPHRYAATGIRPETMFPGLFVGGSDLTVGDSFSASMVSGWMVANSVLKYSFIDYLFLEKNVTNDMSQYLTNPKIRDEDVAVPYSENQNVVKDENGKMERKVSEEEAEKNDKELTAESTKEE